MSAKSPMSILLYNRLLNYLRYLQQRPEEERDAVTSAVISAALGTSEAQVRKDLSAVHDGGAPETEYVTQDLIAGLERFLGHDNYTDAVLVGAGNLGRSFLAYEKFKSYGLKIVAAFDSDPERIGQTIHGVQVLGAEKIGSICRRMAVHIGIITVPHDQAQAVCDQMVQGGIRAIWNFAPVNLEAPRNIIVKNEDMAASLAVLTRQVADSIAEDY